MEKERDIKIEKGFPELWRKKEIPRNKRDIQSYGERNRCQDVKIERRYPDRKRF